MLALQSKECYYGLYFLRKLCSRNFKLSNCFNIPIFDIHHRSTLLITNSYNFASAPASKVKVKVKQPYLTSITRNSNSTDKPDVDVTLILLPPRHQCSVLRVFKATQATQNGKKSKQECEIRESNSGPLAPRPRTNRLCHPRSSILQWY